MGHIQKSLLVNSKEPIWIIRTNRSIATNWCFRITARVSVRCGHVITIREQISNTNAIRRDKPMQFRVIVPAAQPVHPRLVVVDISAVAERVRVAQGVRQLTRAAQLSAPCAVLVFYHDCAVRVKVLWHEKRPAGEGGAGQMVELYSTEIDLHNTRKTSPEMNCISVSMLSASSLIKGSSQASRATV